MNDQVTEDPQTIIDRVEAMSTASESPCGDGRMVWRVWDVSGGSAPILVLYHGGAGSWRHWIRNIPVLMQRYRVVVPDLPGLGDSDLPPDNTDAWSMAQIVVDGLDTVIGTDAMFDVVGFSFGATMAACTGVLREGRVRSVMIVAASGVSNVSGAVEMLKVRHLEGPERVEAHRENLARLMIADRAKIDDLSLVIQDWGTVRSRIKSPSISRNGTIRIALDRITAPVNGIWGELDAPAAPRTEPRVAAMRERFPNADVRVVPGAGHWVAYEAADTVNAWLVEILARTRP